MKRKIGVRLLALGLSLILVSSDVLPVIAQESSSSKEIVLDDTQTEIIEGQDEKVEDEPAALEEKTTETETEDSEEQIETLTVDSEEQVETSTEDLEEQVETTKVSTDQENAGFTITDGVLTSYVGDAKEIYIASNVTRIEEGAFLAANCPNLKDIHITATEEINMNSDAFDFSVLVYVSDELVNSYAVLGGSTQTWHLAPESAVLNESGYVISEDGTQLYAYIPSRNSGENADVALIPEAVEVIWPKAILEKITEIRFAATTPPIMGSYICTGENTAGADLIIRIPSGAYENYVDVNEEAVGGTLWPEDASMDEETGFVVSEIFWSQHQMQENM